MPDAADRPAELPAAEGAAGPEASKLRRRPPVATLGLLVAVQLMALAQFAVSGFQPRGAMGLEIGSSPADWALGAKLPSLIAQGEYWRLVTASFLHATWFPHLLLNLLGLLGLGFLVETFYGSARMLVIFVLGAVGGTVASYLWTPAVSLGASTGVMALLGAMVTHHSRYGRFLPPRIARWYPFLVAMVFMQLVMDSMSTRVDIFGHLGGLVTGLFLGRALEGRIAGPLQSEREWLPLPAALATVVILLLYGALGLAFSLPREASLLRAARLPDGQLQAEALREIARARPDLAEARLQLVRSLLAVRTSAGVREAAAELQAFLNAYPGFREEPQLRDTRRAVSLALYRFSQAHYLQGRYELALEETLLLAELADDRELQADAHNTYAWILVDRLSRDLDEAERHALLATGMVAENAAYLDTLAWVYFHQGRLPEALHTQQRAVAIAERDPRYRQDSGELYYHLGAIHEKLGQAAEAITAYGRAVTDRRVGPAARAGLERLQGPPPPAAPRLQDDPAVRRGVS
jgi:membrane associated rhomboid family serine protease/tetratricopeptide (TPR) repeat protein